MARAPFLNAARVALALAAVCGLGACAIVAPPLASEGGEPTRGWTPWPWDDEEDILPQ